MCKCENVQMCKCGQYANVVNVQMWECANVQMKVTFTFWFHAYLISCSLDFMHSWYLFLDFSLLIIKYKIYVQYCVLS